VESVLDDPFALAGTVLEGQYRADAVIGEGGFGVVYRGKHLSLEQPIAIKVLKGLDGGDPTINALVLEKFRAEARLLYTLSQSSLHIVRALDFGASTMPSGAWAPFMILEWLDGCSLAEDLTQRQRTGLGGRSVAEAFAILEPVADGLATAHHRQVAHRDVKPANIFLLRGGGHGRGPGQQGPLVKVLDFGIAKIMKDGEAAGTNGTFASFTWLYAAPEQLDPRVGTTGLATDVYAFGLLLTELLSGRRPIDGRDVVGILKTATDPHRRPTPRTLGANVPDAIEAVCLRALAVNPKDRYPTISELWAALAAARDSSIPGRGATTMVPSVAGSAMSGVRSPSTAPMAQTGVAPSPQTSSALRTTALPMSAPLGMTGPPAGTRPPGFVATPPPSAMMPPTLTSRDLMTAGRDRELMTAHPMTYAASPPPGTAPPGQPLRRMPVPRAEGSNTLVILTIIFFVFAMILAGTCAAVHSACG
jgi:eukaryotic-like serine/threonine-protein kinase